MFIFFWTILLLSQFLCISAMRPNFPYYNNKEEKKKDCKCVLPNFCGDDDVLVNGQGLLDPRLDNGGCSSYYEVCCENPIKATSLTKNKKCGIQKVGSGNIGFRITSDSKITQFGELPWNVILLETSQGMEKTYRCGGSLIHPQVVITAAHCVSDIETDGKKIVVRAGEWNIQGKDEPLPYQDAIVEEIVLHPNYNQLTLHNDIAILFLGEAFILADNVDVICLPNPELSNDLSRCIASGWGKDSFRNGKFSTVLKKIDIPIVPRDKCLFLLRNTRLGKFYNLHRSFICAGGEKNKDTCKGDGGSPLICLIDGEKDRFVQTGIVSWGIGCGDNKVPGVYVNLAIFVDWIDNELMERELDDTLYKY